MTDTGPRIRPLRGLLAAALGLFVIMLLFGVSKKTGWLDPETARRGAAAMMGLMLAVTGNFIPKLRLFQPADGTPAGGVDRFAGWTFMVVGLAFALLWLFAPAERAMLGTSMVGFAGFLVVLARWLFWRERHGEAGLPRLTPGRILLAIFLVSLLWSLGIFFADAVWGDAISQWLAIIFVLVMAAASPLLIFALRRHGGKA